jgi:hypothetical protein
MTTCERRVALGARCGNPTVPTYGPHRLCSECRLETARAVKARVRQLTAELLREEAMLASLEINLAAYAEEGRKP